MPASASRRDVALNERAIESLEFIRTTMARSAAFTAVPGRGGIAMGVVGFVAAAIASQQATPWAWLATWLTAATLAAAIGFVTMERKARRNEVALWSFAGRRFAQGFAPPLAAGAVLTLAMALSGRFDLLPATWLLLYGAGVLAGAVSSIGLLTGLGAALMLLGAAASLNLPVPGDVWLAAGFGGLHVVFGAVIASRHGG